MATQISRRLMAAGASPERACAFEQQFTQKLQSAQPTITRPKDIQDAFDEQLAAFSAAAFPNTFKPQSLSDAQLQAYIIGTYGQQKYDDLTKKASPFYNSALNSSNAYIKDIANAAKQGIDIGSVIASIRNDALEDETQFGGLKEADVVSQANKIYTDYTRAANAVKGFLKTDSYYKVNLPHPNLKYGKEENLEKGIINYKTHPSVAKYLASPEAKTQAKGIPGIARTAPSSYMVDPKNPQASIAAFDKMRQDALPYEEKLFKAFEKSGAKPFLDEVKRRESFKKTTTLTGK